MSESPLFVTNEKVSWKWIMKWFICLIEQKLGRSSFFWSPHFWLIWQIEPKLIITDWFPSARQLAFFVPDRTYEWHPGQCNKDHAKKWNLTRGGEGWHKKIVLIPFKVSNLGMQTFITYFAKSGSRSIPKP